VQVHNRDTLRWLAIDGQRVVAVIHDSDIEEVHAWRLRSYATHIHVTSWRHASEAQREVGQRLPVTIISAALWRPMGAGGGRRRATPSTFAEGNSCGEKSGEYRTFLQTRNLADCARIDQ